MMTSPEVLRARRILDRLKRGVPPAEGLEYLSVGMDVLHRRLNGLLAQNSSPRWLAVQSEYGEGKSHFHSFARHHALQAGYAVASLDVNKDDGALHQPQRHLAVVLDCLRSPHSDFEQHQGFGAVVRAWLESTPRREAVQVLRRCQAVVPFTPAGRDPGNFACWIGTLAGSSGRPLAMSPWYAAILRYLTAEDLTTRGAAARFAAAYRLQVIQEWLLATGHRGLLFFIDEVDNVVRQIHGKGHPACFRTLAWYCTCPRLQHVRVIFASTPEVLDKLDHGRGKYFLQLLRSRETGRREEVALYEGWLREMEQQARTGWLRCPLLTISQRVELFRRIAALHKVAWGSSHFFSGEEPTNLARLPQFPTTRRWVRAVVQILDLKNENLRDKELLAAAQRA
jgi:hypothetical protein